MADETTFDPEEARRRFNAIGAVTADIKAALAGVRGIRSTLSEPWGTDETGKKFSQKREPNAVELLNKVDSGIAQVESFSETGKKNVTELERLDADNARRIGPKN